MADVLRHSGSRNGLGLIAMRYPLSITPSKPSPEHRLIMPEPGIPLCGSLDSCSCNAGDLVGGESDGLLGRGQP